MIWGAWGQVTPGGGGEVGRIVCVSASMVYYLNRLCDLVGGWRQGAGVVRVKVLGLRGSGCWGRTCMYESDMLVGFMHRDECYVSEMHGEHDSLRGY